MQWLGTASYLCYLLAIFPGILLFDIFHWMLSSIQPAWDNTARALAAIYTALIISSLLYRLPFLAQWWARESVIGFNEPDNLMLEFEREREEVLNEQFEDGFVLIWQSCVHLGLSFSYLFKACAYFFSSASTYPVFFCSVCMCTCLLCSSGSSGDGWDLENPTS